jgi:hypothetical protein
VAIKEGENEHRTTSSGRHKREPHAELERRSFRRLGNAITVSLGHIAIYRTTSR